MSDYYCLTVESRPGEPESEFKTRLSQFWTHMLRNFGEVFEKVYAETTSFMSEGDRLTRQYLIEASAADDVEREMSAAGVGHRPIDREEVYSKYEAQPPDWMWIEH